MDIKLSETFRTIWCVLAFSAIQELRDFLSFKRRGKTKVKLVITLECFKRTRKWKEENWK